MPKIAIPKLNRRQFVVSAPCFGQVFLGLVDNQTKAAKAKQFIRELPTFLNSLPPPKFAMGQRVINLYTVDDDLDPANGLTVQNKGVVIGMWWNDKNIEAHQYGSDLDFYYHGWVYVVHFVDLPRERHFEQMRSPVAEEELQPW